MRLWKSEFPSNLHLNWSAFLHSQSSSKSSTHQTFSHVKTVFESINIKNALVSSWPPRHSNTEMIIACLLSCCLCWTMILYDQSQVLVSVCLSQCHLESDRIWLQHQQTRRDTATSSSALDNGWTWISNSPNFICFLRETQGLAATYDDCLVPDPHPLFMDSGT